MHHDDNFHCGLNSNSTDSSIDSSEISRITLVEELVPSETGFAIVIDNILSEVECKALIYHSEHKCGKGYQPALLNVGRCGPTGNSSDRLICRDSITAGIIWERIRDFIPEHSHGRPVIGLDSQLFFHRFDENQELRPKVDTPYKSAKDSATSVITVQLFLNGNDDNTEFTGGATKLLESPLLCNDVEVLPRAGRVLLFQHAGILNCVEPVTQGREYIARMLVMYDTKT